MADISKTIGWAQYSLNPITGCLNHVDGYCKGGGFKCYAWWIANGRAKRRYLDNVWLPELWGDEVVFNKGCTELEYNKHLKDPFYPRFWPERLTTKGIPKGSLIFLDDMSDWMGPWIPDYWKRATLDFIRANHDWTFLTLTKQPQELPKWEYPENCWVGVTITKQNQLDVTLPYLKQVEATVKFVSFEPLLESMGL